MPSWKQKALLQRALSVVPQGHRLNFVLQRHITHGLPVPDHELRAAAELGLQHAGALADVLERPLTDARFFEFGAGFDLHMPLILWSLGVEHQVVVDLRPILRPELVAEVVHRLRGPMHEARFRRVLPPAPTRKIDVLHYLADIGIEYRAPADARDTGLDSGSVDCITSTNTLEHIPPQDIASILSECRRILADDGWMSFVIDYQDHYSYFDRSISVYNFLTFEPADWRRFNSSLHFQNRLRHQDHCRLIERAGFRVVDELRAAGSDADLALLREMDLAEPFATYDLPEVAVRSSRLLLAKDTGRSG